MKYNLKELVDLKKLQTLTDRLYEAARIPTAIISVDGELLTQSGWQRICSDFHRKHPDTRKDCIASDTRISKQIESGQPFSIHTCPRGLTDASIPIEIDGVHVANAFVGQLFLEEPDGDTEQFFRDQARKFGFDEKDYLEAFREIQVKPLESFRASLVFLAEVTQMFADMGFQRQKELEALAKHAESERQYRSLYNNINEAIALFEIVTDDTGKVNDLLCLDCNPMFESLVLLERHQIIGQQGRLVVPVIEDHWIEAFGEVAIKGEPVTLIAHSEYINKYLEVKAYSPEPSKVAVALTDVTERMLATEKLELNNRRWKRAQQVAHIGNWEYDPKSKLFWGSEETFRLFGVPFNPGDNQDQVMEWENVKASIPQWEKITKAFSDLVEGKALYDVEFELIPQNGEAKRIIQSKAELERNELGLPVKVVGTIQDITLEKQHELALLESEEKFKALAEYSTDTIMRFDRNHKHLYANPAAKTLTGIEAEAFLGKSHEELGFPTDLVMRWEEAIDYVFEKGEAHRIEFSLPDGIHVDWRLTPEFSKAGDVIAVITSARDITDRKRAEEAFEKRLIALTRPLDDPEGITFEDLFNTEDIQHLQDQFANATGVASIITHPDGTPITKPSNFCRLCNDIIRKTEKGLHNCYKSDAELGKFKKDGPAIQPCLSGGLWDAGAGISVGGKNIANWLIGQVRDETQTDDKMRAYAREIGANEDEVIEAFHEVPAMSKQQFSRISQALFTLANQLSISAYQNVQQARFITEQKRSREEILKFRTIADKAVHGNLITDMDGIIVYANDYMANIHGYTPEEVTGKHLSIFHTESQLDSVEHALSILFKRGNYEAKELWHVHRDGTEFPMLMSAVTIEDDRDTPLFMTATAIDITERKKTEERYKIINDSTHDFIFSQNLEGRLTSANKALCDALGMTEDQLIGQTQTELGFPQEQIDLWNRAQQHIIENAGSIKERTSVLAPDGIEHHFELDLNPLLNKHNEVIGISGSARDITDRVMAEEEKDKVKAQLQQSQKMESIGRLAGGVAHDFNNLLTSITGNVHLALLDLSAGDPLILPLQEINKAADSAASLTRQLLAFSRKQIISPKILDLNALIDNTQKMLGRLIGEDIELVIKPKRKLGYIKADPGQIEQVLINLSVNARDAMPDGGRLIIETQDVELDDAYCRINPSVYPGQYSMLAVSDSGYGMDDETRSMIFDPFFTTKKEGEGTGLGLAMVYGIVKQHGGHINVYSTPGNGTSFKVYFPKVEGEMDNITSSARPSVLPRGSETVLVVEDEPMVRTIAIRILEKQGYTVHHADSGGNALALVEAQNLEPDLLLTDIVMPNMNGRELSEILLAKSPELKVLFTSGYTEEVIAHHGILDEGLNFIGKPYTPKALAHKVREVLDQKPS